MAEATIMEVIGSFSATAGYGYWGWLPMVGAALFASIVLLAFVYVWATLFRDNNLLSLVKLEFYEMVVTIVLVFFLLMVVGFMTGLKVSSFVPSALIPSAIDPNMNIYQLTEDYFNKVGTSFGDWLNLNYIANVYVDQVASVTPYSRPMGIGLIASPMAGLASPIKQLLYNATSALAIAYVVNYAQYYTFLFAVAAFLKYFLPVGIFLRAFTPTRRVGGSIIGVCMGFLIVYPLLITLTYFIFYSDNGPLVTFGGFVRDYIYDNTDFSALFGTFMNPGNFSFSDFFSGILGGIGTMIKTVFKMVFVNIMMFPIALVGQAFVIGFVMPAFNILMFTQATISLSKSFGEEVDIGALTRMI